MIRSLVLQPIDETRKEVGAIRLTHFPCTIGRARDCEPRLNLHRISRRHLRLAIDGDRVVVEDLGSTNGTFVNEERINAPAALRPGDSLHIADYAFRVERFAEIDQQASERAGEPDTLAGQTIAGFTEDPTGFPVQAPQLYELLNDSLLEPLATEARVDPGSRDALLVIGRSTHPALKAGHDRLARMARQLGEEARYHGILRELAARAADEAGLDNRLLILPVDALEVEDAAVLLGELEDLAKRYRRLELGCCIDPSDMDATTLEQLARSLEAIDMTLTTRATDGEAGQSPPIAAMAVVSIEGDAAARPVDDYF